MPAARKTVAPKKVFRIERVRAMSSGGEGTGGDNLAEARHREIMTALYQLQQFGDAERRDAPAAKKRDDRQADHADTGQLKAELQRIYKAVAATKREIAAIHHMGQVGDPLSSAADELAAIVSSTERATETILQAAEDIDQKAANLAAGLQQREYVDMASDIQDRIVAIFEASNFQDLTGQRLTKVMDLVRGVEDRVCRMIEIWGGLESFEDVGRRDRKGDESAGRLGNPGADGDDDTASQNDIDTLFE